MDANILKQYLAIISLVIPSLLSCGSDSHSGAKILGTLPTITAPVAAKSSAIATPRRTINRSAKTGLPISSASTTDWNGKSGVECRNINELAQAFSQAGRADSMKCLVSVGVDNSFFPNFEFDGTAHYYSFGGTSGQANSPEAFVVNINATKDSAGSINQFTMQDCRGSNSTLNDYINYSINSESITATSYSSYSQSGQNPYSNQQLTVAQGTFNSAGQWTAKTISTNFTGSGGTGQNAYDLALQISFIQESDSATLSGYETGTWSGQSHTGRFYSVFELLNATSLATFAVGDGSSNALFSDGMQSAQVVSWDGDTQLNITAAQGKFYSLVSNSTLPDLATPDITQPAAANWNCSPPSGSSFREVTFGDSATLPQSVQDCISQYMVGGAFSSCNGASY